MNSKDGKMARSSCFSRYWQSKNFSFGKGYRHETREAHPDMRPPNLHSVRCWTGLGVRSSNCWTVNFQPDLGSRPKKSVGIWPKTIQLYRFLWFSHNRQKLTHWLGCRRCTQYSVLIASFEEATSSQICSAMHDWNFVLQFSEWDPVSVESPKDVALMRITERFPVTCDDANVDEMSS